jgi:hypothetical protein
LKHPDGTQNSTLRELSLGDVGQKERDHVDFTNGSHARHLGLAAHNLLGRDASETLVIGGANEVSRTCEKKHMAKYDFTNDSRAPVDTRASWWIPSIRNYER